MSETLGKAFEMKEYLTNIRRQIHQNPELSLKEYETTKRIKKELAAMGIPLQELDMETGCVAIIKGEKQGSDYVSAIRADMDALPIAEKTGLEYGSNNPGVMHACGHDGHTATLLGVARLLNSLKSEFSGTVKLVFQPAEEGGSGAKKMVTAGATRNPKPDEIIALHAWPALPVKTIGILPGKFMAGAAGFTVKIKGRGGHGARPSESINPITTGAAVVGALSNIVSSEIPTLDAVVLTVCAFNGGKALSVIPDDITLGGTVRSLENENFQIVFDAIERIVSGICQSYGCTFKCSFTQGAGALYNDEETTEKVRLAAGKAIGEDNVVLLKQPSMGSEDFPEFIMDIGKGCMIRLGTAFDDTPSASLHNDKFNFNDEALPYGVAVLSQFILDKHQ